VSSTGSNARRGGVNEAGKLNLFSWLRRRRRKSSSERLPWYRAPDYSGNLTEAEKRELHAFRMQARHPAYQYGDLPEHVESYIARLEIEAYDLSRSEPPRAPSQLP
jgi:hypothetical protein